MAKQAAKSLKTQKKTLIDSLATNEAEYLQLIISHQEKTAQSTTGTLSEYFTACAEKNRQKLKALKVPNKRT